MSAAKLTAMTAQDDAVTRALDKTWAQIRERAPKVPGPIVWDLTPGVPSSCVTIGWDQSTPVISVNLKPHGQDGPNATAAEVLTFLLHMASHAVVPPSPSSGGRYHPSSFRTAAEQLGLDAKLGANGFDNLELATGSRTYYRSSLTALERALSKWEPGSFEASRGEPYPRNGVVLACKCGEVNDHEPRKIRLRGREPDVTGILCEICNSHFLPVF